MKRKILSLLVLLLMAVTGAWADNLYLEVSGTSATLKYGSVPGKNPYYTVSETESGTKSEWIDIGDNQETITSITVDGTCGSFTGTSLYYLFGNFGKLTSINNIGNLNTTNVTDMRAMFHTCGALTTLDLSNWNTSNVSSMITMFAYCGSLTSLNISGWNTASVTDMSGMFNNCSKLTAIYVGNNWNVNNVSNSTDMFYACSNLPNWDEEKIDKTHANTGADGYLNKVKVTANLASGAYWGTFYSNVGNHLAPEGTQVFAVNLTGTTIEMTEIGDRIVKSGEGVVLKQATESADATTTIIMTLTDATPNGDFRTNSLKGSMTEITNPGNAYVLNNGTAGIGFYKLSKSGTIGANKAYLTYDDKAGTRAFFGLDETTGVNEVMGKKEDERGEYYDLQGHRVAQPTKGLYIVNGKKVFIK